MSEKYTNRREVSYRHENEIVAESLDQKQDKAPMMALLLASVGLIVNFQNFWNSLIIGMGTVDVWLLRMAALLSYFFIVLSMFLYRRRKTVFAGIGFIILSVLASINFFSNIAINELNIYVLMNVIKIISFVLCGLGYFLPSKVGKVFNLIGSISLITSVTIIIMTNIMEYPWSVIKYQVQFTNLQPIMLGVSVLLYCPKKKI